jgi:hypothetical protein
VIKERRNKITESQNNKITDILKKMDISYENSYLEYLVNHKELLKEDLIEN